MKKLSIVLGAVLVATFAQASTITWAAGKVYAPDEDGAIATYDQSQSKWIFGDAVGSSYGVKMYVWESTSQQAFSSGDLYKQYVAGTLSGAIEGEYTPSSSAATAVGVLSQEAGKTTYGNVLFVLTDASTGDDLWYMENAASKDAASGVQKANFLAMYPNGSSSASPMSWTAVAVPEPFSGSLALLGMGLVALRRKMKKAKKA